MALACAFHPGFGTAQDRTVAITVDDLPLQSPRPLAPSDARTAVWVNKRILRAFAAQHVPAVGFVVEQKVEQLGPGSGKDILKRWTRPGLTLGNHFYSHPDVNALTIEQAEDEIVRGETTFRPLLERVSRHPAFLRFPYNHTGDTKEKHDAIAAFMAAHGYMLAPCTVDNSDYIFDGAYVLALAARDKQTAQRIRDEYISYTGAEIDWYTRLNKQVLGYEPPQVMLLHDNALNADTIEQVLSLFRQRQYRFVTLGQALESPAYAIPETYITKYGPMWGYRWAKELGIQVNGRDEPEPPAWIDAYRKEHGSP